MPDSLRPTKDKPVAELPSGITSFFAPNTTLALLGVLEYKIHRAGAWLATTPSHKDLHPVISAATAHLSKGPLKKGAIRINTLMHWITGAYSADVLANIEDAAGKVIEIIDGAQAFGNLHKVEVQQLFLAVRRGAIVVGCMQKWIGCPLPLGFALLPTTLLQDDPAFKEHLAARDYLGNAIGVRRGYSMFPDTYSASLVPVASNSLQLAFGEKWDELESLRQNIETNRKFIETTVRGLGASYTVNSDPECRGILAVQARAAVASKASKALDDHSFEHTVIRDWPYRGMTTLRLSAPRVKMDADTRSTFQSIIRSVQ
jgi:hypothetical protein